MARTRYRVKCTSQEIPWFNSKYNTGEVASINESFHPDYRFNARSLYWNTGNGFRTDNCLNAEGNYQFNRSYSNVSYVGTAPDFYIGAGTPQEAAASSGALASDLVGSQIGVVYNKECTQRSNVGSVVEGETFTEYDRAMSVNHPGWGKVGYGSSSFVDSATWTYTNVSMKFPDGVTSNGYVKASAVEASKSTYYGIFVGGVRVSNKTSCYISDKRDITDIVAVFGLKFTVKFAANGGDGTMANAARVFGVGAYVPQDALPACAFTKPGMVFAGWNTKADGTGTAIPDGAGIDGGFEGVVTVGGQSVTLHAQWRAPNIVATKANADAAGASVASVGTLRLFGPDDGYASPVATEGDDHVLRFEGAAGKVYRLSCLMGGEDTADFRWDALGVESGGAYSTVYEIDFTEAASAQTPVFLFAAKPLYTFEVVSAHGTVAVSPEEDAEGGKYARGRTVSISITPEAGWEAKQVVFVNVDTNDVYPTTIKDNAASLDGITFNTRAAVDYAQIDYPLAASVHAASAHAVASVSVAVGGEAAETAHHGDVATFRATVAEGFSFAGWYTEDGALVSEEAEYGATVTGPLSLVARAKVAVTLGISYAGEGARSCTLAVNGEAYTPGTPFQVVLGGSFAYALALGERADGAAWQFDCWKSGDETLPHPQDGTLAPTAALAMTAHVAASVSRALEVFVAKMGESASMLVDADDVPGAVTCVGLATEAVAEAGGSGAADPFLFTFGRTQYVRVTALAELAFPGTEGALSFYCLSSEAPGPSVPPSEGSVVSFETGAEILLNAAKRTLYAYYGTPKAVVTTLAYAALSDATMGTVAFTAVDPDDAAAEIGADGMSATATQGKSVTMRATPANGYRFAGWFLSASATGDPAWADAEATVRVTARRTIYAKFAKDAHSVCEWEGSATPKALVWRSKTYESSKPFNPSACRVDALGYDGDGKGTLLELAVDMFSAPDAAPTATVRLANIANQNARRLPVRRMERYMQVEVKANVEIDALLVGTSMGGLAQ